MTGKLHILEPWNVLPDAEFLSLDLTTGNLRIRVAGEERIYLGTAFRLNEVRLPVQHIAVLGMPGGVISIATASPDFGPIPQAAEPTQLDPKPPQSAARPEK